MWTKLMKELYDAIDEDEGGFNTNPNMHNDRIADFLLDMGRDYRDDRDASQDLSHELAHFMIAPLSRRYKKRFDLGEIGMGRNRRCELEEEMASILGILVQREHALDFGFTLAYHNWVDVPERIENNLNKLYERKLIDEKGRPTFCRRR